MEQKEFAYYELQKSFRKISTVSDRMVEFVGNIYCKSLY
jgi:hypothetical protein